MANQVVSQSITKDVLYKQLESKHKRPDRGVAQATNPDKAKAMQVLKSTLAEINQSNSDPVIQQTYGKISFALEFSYRLFRAHYANERPPLTRAEIKAAVNATLPGSMAPLLAAGGRDVASLSAASKALMLKLFRSVAFDQGVYGNHYSTYRKKGYHGDPEEFLSSLGYEKTQVLLSCHYQSEMINCYNYTEDVFDQIYGRCFLLDMKRDQGAGGLGLSALVDTHTELGWPYFPSAADGVSLRVQHEFNPVSYRILHVPSGSIATVLLRGSHYKLRNIIKKV